MTSIISDYGPAFRSPEDFRADAERRQWLESPAGRAAMAKARIRETRRHEAAMVLSPHYAAQQAHIEAALKGVDSGFRGEFISAEAAILGFGR